MPTETPELELAPVKDGEPSMKQLAPFDSFRAQAEKLKITAETLNVTDANDRAGMALARTTRLTFREIRVAVEHRRKELGEEALRTTQRINADAKTMKDFCEAQESRLLEMEEFAEREAARIAEENRIARTAEITPFLSAPLAIDLGAMPANAYAAMLSDAKDAHAAKLAREKKEQEEAAAKLKAEAEERERIRLENERLKKEAAEHEEAARKEREEAAAALEKEKAKAAAEAKKLREAADERERIASEKAKAEAEKARKEHEAVEAETAKENARLAKIAEEQRQKTASLAAELARKKAAEEKVEAERLAAQKAAALAPEREKLNALAKTIRELHIPVLKTEKGIVAVVEISAKVEAFAAWVSKKAESL